MKFPKNRANIYVVVREDYDPVYDRLNGIALLGSFPDAVEADNFKDACAAEWFDRKLPASSVFDVRLSTFYG